MNDCHICIVSDLTKNLAAPVRLRFAFMERFVEQMFLAEPNNSFYSSNSLLETFLSKKDLIWTE